MNPVTNTQTPATRPATVMVVAALVLIEALAVLGYAVYYLMHLGDAGELNIGGRIFMLVLCVGAAAWQLSVAVNFFRGRAWTRAAIIVWQLFQVIMAVTYLQTSMFVIALVALLIAGGALILLFAPATTAYLGDRPQR